MDPEQPPQRTASTGALKALASPLRQQILQHLTVNGPATSTTLARALGGTSGGTSYNVRILAEHGFVEEVPGLRRGRERWWRPVVSDTRIPVRSEMDPQMRAVFQELRELWQAGDEEMFKRFHARRDELGEWADAMPFSRGSVRLTLPELRDFFEAYLALLKRYQRPADQEPPGAHTMLAHFLAFPAVDERGDLR